MPPHRNPARSSATASSTAITTQEMPITIRPRNGELQAFKVEDRARRQADADEIDQHLVAHLAHIDAHLAMRQIDDDPAFAVGATLEIEVAQDGAAGRRRGRDWRWRHRHAAGIHATRYTAAAIDRHDDHLAVDDGGVVQRALQVQHHAGAGPGLHDVGPVATGVMFPVLDCGVCGAVVGDAVSGDTTAFTGSSGAAFAGCGAGVELTAAEPVAAGCPVDVAVTAGAGGVVAVTADAVAADFVAADVATGAVPLVSICFKLSAFSISSARLSKFSCSISC